MINDLPMRLSTHHQGTQVNDQKPRPIITLPKSTPKPKPRKRK